MMVSESDNYTFAHHRRNTIDHCGGMGLAKKGLALLPLEQLREIVQDIAALTEQTSRPSIRSMLDRSAGTCRVCAYRPAWASLLCTVLLGSSHYHNFCPS